MSDEATPPAESAPTEPKAVPLAPGPKPEPINLGVYGRRGTGPSFSAAEVIALLLSVVWLLGVGSFFLFLPNNSQLGVDPLRMMITLLAIFMPVALIWVAATAARSARIVREESARLQAAIDAMRHTYVAQQQATGAKVKQGAGENGGSPPGAAPGGPSDAASADGPRAAGDPMGQQDPAAGEGSVARFASTRTSSAAQLSPLAPRPAQASAGKQAPRPGAEPLAAQPSLALGTPAEDIAPPLDMADLIKALNFPQDTEDRDGFRALRAAMQDRIASQLVQASQDVLTLLSQEGIYMDDLHPDRARPELWRRFAAGERGRPIAALGGVRDRSSLSLSAARMRADPIFRDATHHFLRRFDHTFSDIAENATDADISAIADTRTARAFMLLGRVTGTFD